MQIAAAVRPDVVVADTGTAYEGVTIDLVRKESADITKEFRHMVKRTGDPKQRYESALKYLAASYYQHPAEFSGNLTALFGPGSAAAAENLLTASRAALMFDEKNQKYVLPCTVNLLVLLMTGKPLFGTINCSRT